MKKTAFIVYLVLIHFILIAIILKPERVHTATYKLGIYPKPLHYDKLLARHLIQDIRIKQGDILLLGDSIMEKSHLEHQIPNSWNLGISKDWTQGLAQRMPLYRSLSKAGLFMVHIGINDVSLRKKSALESFAHYQDMLTHLPKDIPVILNSVLPLGSGKEKSQADNEKIAQFNQLIKQYADSHEGFVYLDISSQMQNEQGGLKSEYHIYDYIHLNPAGYKVFNQIITTFLASYPTRKLYSPN